MRIDTINSWTGERRSCIVSLDEYGQVSEGYWIDSGVELTRNEIFFIQEIIVK